MYRSCLSASQPDGAFVWIEEITSAVAELCRNRYVTQGLEVVFSLLVLDKLGTRTRLSLDTGYFEREMMFITNNQAEGT